MAPLLWVKNIRKSLAFYERLGFNVNDTWEPEGKLTWCSMSFDGAELMLQQQADETTLATEERVHEEIELYFICVNVDSLFQTYTEQGIQVSKPKRAFYPMKQMFLEDPDGRTLCFETPASL